MPMKRRPGDEPGSDELAELAALADGSLAPKRRAALEARVAADPELADRLAEQRRAVALTRGAAAEVEAPLALRERIATPRPARRAPMRRGLILAAAVVPLVLAIVIGVRVIDSGTSGESFRAALAPTAVASRRRRGRDVHEDGLGLEDRARRHGVAAPSGRALLPGVAAQPRRRARTHRDVQRRP